MNILWAAIMNIPLLLFLILILITISKVLGSSAKQLMKSTRLTVSSDGHLVSPEEDLTCEHEYGHNHQNTGPRYIVHQEATDGYVVLNGVKRKISDCKNL